MNLHNNVATAVVLKFNSCLHQCSSGGVRFESRTLPHNMSALLVLRLVSFTELAFIVVISSSGNLGAYWGRGGGGTLYRFYVAAHHRCPPGSGHCRSAARKTLFAAALQHSTGCTQQFAGKRQTEQPYTNNAYKNVLWNQRTDGHTVLQAR